jgi:uncharacterized protein YciW
MSIESTQTRDDFVAQVARFDPHGAVAALRAHRADVTRHTQGSLDTLLDAELDDFPLAERLAVAAYAAALVHAHETAHAYRKRLALYSPETDALLDTLIELPHASTAWESAPPRLAAVLTHTRAVTLSPAQTADNGPAALTALQRAGLSSRAIVVLSQLIAFVSYQVRVVAALHALEGEA